MVNFEFLYRQIKYDLRNRAELVGSNYEVCLKNYADSMNSGISVFNKNRNETIDKRKATERHFYNFLEHQLFTNLQEMKYYSDVNLNDTRRLISVSNNCISMIHILLRNKMYINVYFRSSDFNGALPCDLEFISSLPYKLITHCYMMKGLQDYPEVNDEFINKLKNFEVQYNIMFGSLHKTI